MDFNGDRRMSIESETRELMWRNILNKQNERERHCRIGRIIPKSVARGGKVFADTFRSAIQSITKPQEFDRRYMPDHIEI